MKVCMVIFLKNQWYGVYFPKTLFYNFIALIKVVGYIYNADSYLSYKHMFSLLYFSYGRIVERMGGARYLIL